MKISGLVNLIQGAQAEIEVETSRSGLSCLWENGGAWSNTGGSQVICDRFGNAKKAIYVPTHGDLCNGGHALIPVTVGDIVVDDKQHHENHEVSVWKIIRIEDGKATLQLLEYVNNIRLDTERAYNDAIMAAMEKASDYHCRSVYYARY